MPNEPEQRCKSMGSFMKSIQAIYMAALLCASSVLAGLDQDKTLTELDEIHARILDKCPRAPFENANIEHIDDFLTAITQVKELIQEKGKDKWGNQHDEFKKAIKQLDTRSKEIIEILRALKGTKTTEGIKSLKDLLKQHEERLADAEKKLSETDFDKDDKKDDKKKGVEILGEAVHSLKHLITKMSTAAEAKKKLLEKPAKKRPLKAKNSESDDDSECEEEEDPDFDLFFEEYLLDYQLALM